MNINQFIENLKKQHSSCSNLITKNGSLLLKNIPNIAEFAYLHSIYAGLNKAEVEQLDKMTTYQLPVELKQFYMITNGLSLFGGALYLYGLRKDNSREVMAAIQQPFDFAFPNARNRVFHINETIYIGAYRFDGSLVGYDCSTGSIFRQLKTDNLKLNHWPSLSAFINNEHKRLSTFIDNDGEKRDGIVSTVPNEMINEKLIH